MLEVMRRPTLVLVLTALLLAGCGGLGFVDSRPPSGAVVLAGNAQIEVRFDRPLDPALVGRADVTLTQDGERIPTRVVLGGAGDALRIEPLVALRPDTRATLRIEPGVAALGRRRTRQPVELSFGVKASAAPAPTMKSRSFQLQGGTGGALR
jgi:hypothetical protein